MTVVGRHPGSVVQFCTTPRATWHVGTHHALRSALIGLRGAGKTRPVTVVSSTTSIGSPAPPPGQSDASITNQTACVFLTPITLWSCKQSLHVAVHQPRGEQAAASLPTTELMLTSSSSPSPGQTSRCQHRWVVPFRLHPHPGNHRRMHTTCRDGLYRLRSCGFG